MRWLEGVRAMRGFGGKGEEGEEGRLTVYRMPVVLHCHVDLLRLIFLPSIYQINSVCLMLIRCTYVADFTIC